VGACYAKGGGPYAPFAQILRRAFQDGAGGDSDISTELVKTLPPFVLADLITLAPALRLRFPDVPLNPPLDPKSEQQHLFESVVAFCTALSSIAPVMFVVEDLHWGDSGTLALLRHLARRMSRQRLVLVATYREVELDATRPLHQVLQDLRHERLAERLKLSRLDREGTKELLAVLFDAEISPEFAEGIYRETEGNPFFIEEVCKALVDNGEVYFADGHWDWLSMEELEIPQSVRVAIQSRVGKLSSQVQDTLRLAAVLGREFDFETLVAASALAGAADRDEDDLVEALESAEYAQLIGEVSVERGGTFAFTHVLIPTTLVEGLSGLRRRRMHRQVAAAIERLRPHDFESLAFHALEGGDLTKGLEFSLQAAEGARRMFASQEALLHLERAREVAESLDLPEQLVSIDDAMGDVEYWRDIPKSIEAFERALNLATNSQKRATIKSKIGSAYVLVGDERGLVYLEAAEKELDPATQGNELARTISDIGRLYHHRGQHRQALAYLERARQIAEPLDDPLTLAGIYSHLAGSHQHLANLEKSSEWARQTIALGERKDYLLAVASGYEYLGENASTIGDWQAALGFAEQDRRIGEKTGNPHRAAWAEYCDAMTYYGLGDLPAAEGAGQKALAIAEAMGEYRLVALAAAGLSITQTDLGQVEAAEQNARDAIVRAIDLNLTYMICRGQDALAHWYIQQGDWENAFEQLDQSARIVAKTDNRMIPLLDGPRFALACLRTGRLEQAAETVEETLALAEEAPSPQITAETLRVQAQIHAAQGSWEEAESRFGEAITLLEQLGSRLELGRALYHWGEMRANRRQVEGGRATLTKAHEIFQDCGAKIDADRVRAALDSLDAKN
jgi:tetratricopeptide (TPR) repeat protein